MSFSSEAHRCHNETLNRWNHKESFEFLQESKFDQVCTLLKMSSEREREAANSRVIIIYRIDDVIRGRKIRIKPLSLNANESGISGFYCPKKSSGDGAGRRLLIM